MTNKLLLENTNGDIIIDPQLPQFIDFNRGNLEYLGSNGSLFVGLDSILSKVEPNGDSRKNVGSATINASQGSVKLLRGITLNADTDLNIRTQKFIGSGTTTLLGNGPNGEPGRIDSESFQTYTIGVMSFGGESSDATEQTILNETEEVQLSGGTDADLEPELQLVVGFNPDNPNLEQPQPIVINGDENTDATGNVNIFLLSDQSFKVGEFDRNNQSGITSISRISRISANGSLVGDVVPIEETSLGSPPPENVVSSETGDTTDFPKSVVPSENRDKTDFPETPEPEINTIVDLSGLELEIVSGSIARRSTSSNEQSQQELAANNESISLEIESDSEVATGAEQSTSNTESNSEQSATVESALTSSYSNGAESNNNSANQTSANVATEANSNATNQTNNNNSVNQTSNDVVSQSNSNAASESSSNAANQSNSNAASEANSNAANQANSNAANQANSNAASEANSNAASEANSSAANQANSNAANLPASKTSPLPENHLDPSSQLRDNSTVALLPEETELNPDNNPLRHWALPVAGGLLLTGTAGTLLANALFGNSVNALASNILNALGNNSMLKPEPNNSHSKSEQENPQQDSDIEMETTIEPGFMQLSEFPLLDLEISLELEPDTGTQKIYIKDNLVDYDRVKIKSE